MKYFLFILRCLQMNIQYLIPQAHSAVYYPPENKGKLESHTREPEDISQTNISLANIGRYLLCEYFLD